MRLSFIYELNYTGGERVNEPHHLVVAALRRRRRRNAL